MSGYLRIFFVALRNNVATQTAYRANLVFSIVMTFVGELLLPLVTLLIYNTGAGFPGWSMYEILLIQGVFTISRGLSDMLFSGILSNTLYLVSDGTYDLLLIKPVSTLFLSFASSISLDGIGSVLNGILISAFCLSKLGGPANLGVFFLFMVLGLLVLLGFVLLAAGSVFKWVGNSRIYEIFDAAARFGYYPVSIYSRPMRIFVSYIMPVALIGFYPASALLGRPVGQLLVLAVISLAFLALGGLFWKGMLANYTSAGG